ncbi:PREDICTED: fibroblast growth factor 21 isoform X1 [Chinchilla lanigera]|uniref:fibroblast growth factor 21 isoform X1 n=1 Tax=Chinchilla lanigera TaxID=34839 RepID=UPI0006991892|nr:PREDICTED: fibroblast growth factor 21 isoform X1 [Chinchilla lanigera]
MGWAGAKRERPGLWVPVLAVLLMGVCQAHPIPDSSPLLQFGGQVRQRHLYTDDAQDTEAHLEIRPDGSVRGAARRSPESLLELKALKPGVIQILGVRTSRFLCQRPDGTLYGSVSFRTPLRLLSSSQCPAVASRSPASLGVPGCPLPASLQPLQASGCHPCLRKLRRSRVSTRARQDVWTPEKPSLRAVPPAWPHSLLWAWLILGHWEPWP